MRRSALVFALPLALSSACSSNKEAELEARLTEVRTEQERLSREVDDLRRRLPAEGSAQPGNQAGSQTAQPAARSPLTDKVQALDATLGALMEQLSPRGELNPQTLGGVWHATVETGANGPRTVVEEVLHLNDDGKLCGYRLVGAGPSTKEPFWGTWQLRGAYLVELHDRWVGDHNETDGIVRKAALEGRDLLLQVDGHPRRFTRVPADEWKALASLYPDRVAPIPGLPAWCFQAGK